MERGKDILEKQTFQCVKKIKFIPGQRCFKTDVFLDLCSNVDEYCIVDSVDEIPPRVRDGVLYCKDNGCLLTYPSGKSGSFDTPDFVLEYASDAFRGCRNLTSIRLGANVTRKCAVKFEPVLG